MRYASNAICCLKVSQYEPIVDYLVSEFCQSSLKVTIIIIEIKFLMLLSVAIHIYYGCLVPGRPSQDYNEDV